MKTSPINTGTKTKDPDTMAVSATTDGKKPDYFPLDALPNVALRQVFHNLDRQSVLLMRLINKKFCIEASSFFADWRNVYFDEDTATKKLANMEKVMLRRINKNMSTALGVFPLRSIHLETFLPIGETWPETLDIENNVRKLTVTGLMEESSPHFMLNCLGEMTALKELVFWNVAGVFEEVETFRDRRLRLQKVREVTIFMSSNYPHITDFICTVISRCPKLRTLRVDLRGWETGIVCQQILRAAASLRILTLSIEGTLASLHVITEPLSSWTTLELQHMNLRVKKLIIDGHGRPLGIGGQFPEAQEHTMRAVLWTKWNNTLKSLVITVVQDLWDKAVEINHVHLQWLTVLHLPRLSLAQDFATGLAHVKSIKVGTAVVAREPKKKLAKTLERFVFERVQIEGRQHATKRECFLALHKAIGSVRAVATTSRTWEDVLLVGELFPKSTALIINRESFTPASWFLVETTTERTRQVTAPCVQWQENVEDIEFGKEVIMDGETAALVIGGCKYLRSLTFVWNEDNVAVKDLYLGLRGVPVVMLKDSECVEDENLEDMKQHLPGLRCACCED